MTLNTYEQRRYRAFRHDGIPARYALTMTRNLVLWEGLEWEFDPRHGCERAELVRDGIPFTVRFGFDHDSAWEWEREEGEQLPHWWAMVESGNRCDGLGGIGGGWYGPRGDAELDDETRAYLGEILRELCDTIAEQDTRQWAELLSTVGSD